MERGGVSRARGEDWRLNRVTASGLGTSASSGTEFKMGQSHIGVDL